MLLMEQRFSEAKTLILSFPEFTNDEIIFIYARKYLEFNNPSETGPVPTKSVHLTGSHDVDIQARDTHKFPSTPNPVGFVSMCELCISHNVAAEFAFAEAMEIAKSRLYPTSKRGAEMTMCTMESLLESTHVIVEVIEKILFFL